MAKSLVLENTHLHTAANNVSRLYKVVLAAETYVAGGIIFAKAQYPGGEAGFAYIKRAFLERTLFGGGKIWEIGDVDNTDPLNPTFKLKGQEQATGGGSFDDGVSGDPITTTLYIVLEGVPLGGVIDGTTH